MTTPSARDSSERRDGGAVEGHAHLLRRNWIPVLLGIVAVVAGYLYARGSGPESAFGLLGIWMGVLFTPIFVLRNAFRRARAVHVRATERTLEIEGHAPIAVEEIAEAKLVPHPGAHGDVVAELVLRNRKTLSIWAPFAFASAILRTLGIGAGERRSRFALVSPFFGNRFVAALLLIGLPWVITMWALEPSHAGVDPESLLRMIPLCAFIAWVAGFVRGTLIVGAEGLTTRWLLRDRFIPFSEIEDVRSVTRPMNRHAPDTLVMLRSGKRLLLRTIDAPDEEAHRGVEARALLAHVSEAYQRWCSVPAAVDAGQRLLRGQRSPREWRMGLDQLVQGDGFGYRVATVTPELLSTIVRSAPDGEARVGAAAALIRTSAEERRTTVRIAAEACAEPVTHAALLALSEAETEADVEMALQRFAHRE